MLIHLAVIFLTFRSLCNATFNPEENRAIKQILCAMGNDSQETVEYIQPLLAKLSKYPSLAYLKKANNPATVAWILEEYGKINYDPSNRVKELGDVVIDIISRAKTAEMSFIPAPNKCKIVQLCLSEMTKCYANSFAMTEIPMHTITVFPKSTQLNLAEVFPEEWANLANAFVESICKNVENGYDIRNHANKVEQFFEYESFTADYFEMFFQKGLNFYHRLASNWITAAFLRNRIDLAYVCFKRGQKVPERCFHDSGKIPYRHNLDKKLVETFSEYAATKHTAVFMQAVNEIIQDESASYLKLVPVEVIEKIISRFVYDLTFAEILIAVVG